MMSRPGCPVALRIGAVPFLTSIGTSLFAAWIGAGPTGADGWISRGAASEGGAEDAVADCCFVGDTWTTETAITVIKARAAVTRAGAGICHVLAGGISAI